ncbi:unnamed protein product [Dovyalis caffra]|uniref:Ubiquitin-like protein ATG12 n=1 Tax=Dovyalis caffra TaxID=77055 RepID=A0AAV1SS26_9ROSI|nr:unnamed protein product [Dovyalis caffra]
MEKAVIVSGLPGYCKRRKAKTFVDVSKSRIPKSQLPRLFWLSNSRLKATMATESPRSSGKVIVQLKATADAPILKQNKFKIPGTDKFAKVIDFLRRQLHRETVFVYINSAFSPNPDELVIDLFNGVLLSKLKEDASTSAVLATIFSPATAFILGKGVVGSTNWYLKINLKMLTRKQLRYFMAIWFLDLITSEIALVCNLSDRTALVYELTS